MNFKSLLDGVFDEGTEEYTIIEESYNLIVSNAPTIAAEMKTHMILLDHARTKLSTLYYLITREVSRCKRIYEKSYDTQYARLVKLGRPSKDAIEAELKVTCQDYARNYQREEDLLQVKELVSSYMRCIDSCKQSTVEMLRDSRRVD